MSKNIYRYCCKCKYSAPTVNDVCSVCAAKLMRPPVDLIKKKKQIVKVTVADELISLIGL
ncbi:MAG: hypothetical protein ACD_84C00038G0003 [uncultured bacterium]|nr:MAG: hypothetical protein ACD_84C00038G0003 [uncultured bacterium]